MFIATRASIPQAPSERHVYSTARHPFPKLRRSDMCRRCRSYGANQAFSAASYKHSAPTELFFNQALKTDSAIPDREYYAIASTPKFKEQTAATRRIRRARW